jgi:hypothetical protein
MIYKEFDAMDLKTAFEDYGRDYFTVEGCEFIVDYFYDSEFKLDIIALCCSFEELTPREVEERFISYGITEYQHDLEEDDDEQLMFTEWFEQFVQDESFNELTNGNYIKLI